MAATISHLDSHWSAVYYLGMVKKAAPKKRTWVSLTLPDELILRIQHQAQLEDRNRSQVIRRLLSLALAANEKTA